MPGSRTVSLLAAILVFSGCLSGLPGLDPPTLDRAQLPGIEEVDLAGARLTLNMTDCRESHMLVEANASTTAQALPGTFRLAERDEGETRLAVTAIHCRQVTVDDHTARDVTLVEVSVPIDRSEGVATRHDALLALRTPNPRLASVLAEAGLPASTPGSLTRDDLGSYEIADQASIDVDDEAFPVEATYTSVSIETQLPFGTASSVGRHRWVQTANATLEVKPGLNVTELGGVSATLETRPQSRMAELWGNTTRSGSGYQAQYDARLGVLNATS